MILNSITRFTIKVLLMLLSMGVGYTLTIVSVARIIYAYVHDNTDAAYMWGLVVIIGILFINIGQLLYNGVRGVQQGLADEEQ